MPDCACRWHLRMRAGMYVHDVRMEAGTYVCVVQLSQLDWLGEKTTRLLWWSWPYIEA